MLLRALLVMLLVLNAGVAAWWALRGPPSATPPVRIPRGVPTLQLVGDSGEPAGATRDPSPAACYRYGPFRVARAFEAARAALADDVLWTAAARELAGAPRAWRVVLPQASREQAVATAARIGAAGFGDYLVLPAGGPDAHAIALGRYGSEAAARERASTLAAAGFAALAEPVGAREVLWLDVAAREGFAPRSAELGMSGAPIPCTGVPRDGRYTIASPA